MNLHLAVVALVLLLVVLALLLGSGVLVLLVLRDKIVHVRLGLSELHLVHALPSVPVEEGLAPEHERELIRDALPRLLNGSGVPDEDGRHLHARGRDIADGRLEVVRDPLDKIGGVLVDDVKHLVVHLLGGHLAAEHHGAGEVPSVAGIRGAHHVLGVEGLLGQLWDSEDTVVLRGPGSEGRKADEEKVKARERNHVDGQLAQIAVELAREAERARGARDGSRDEVVQVSVARVGELQRAEADVVQGLVVEGEALVRVLHELVDGQRGVVGLDNGVGHLR
mmetsp:Transcript_14405/g.27393  ORF Transcript_14405/g.27393 Transcript_14405/m.27393 type:complete len:280 (+) Transcript_14405:351-1190(+)